MTGRFPAMARPRPLGQIALSIGILVLGAVVLAGAAELPTGGGYAQVGPGVVPRIVGAGVVLMGVLLLREALTGGFRGLDEEEESRIPMDWKAFAWITGGVVAYGLLVERAGFIIASVLLFVAVARSFASRRWASNGLVGLAVGSFIFAVFNYGLGLQLPAGLLRPVLP